MHLYSAPMQAVHRPLFRQNCHRISWTMFLSCHFSPHFNDFCRSDKSFNYGIVYGYWFKKKPKKKVSNLKYINDPTRTAVNPEIYVECQKLKHKYHIKWFSDL